MSVPQVQITALNHYTGKGIPSGGAVALVSVLYRESDLKPGSQGYQSTETPGALNPHGAYGIASWNGPRQQDLFDFATKHALPVDNLLTQLDFVLTEIANKYPASWSAIRSSASYKAIIPIIVDEYEDPKNKQAEINAALAFAAPLAALPPQAAPSPPAQPVPSPTVPQAVPPPPPPPAGPPPMSATVAGIDAAILNQFAAIRDALVAQRDGLNMRIAKIEEQATEFAKLEGIFTPPPLSEIPTIPLALPPPDQPTEGSTTMQAILMSIITNWATSALGTVAGGPAVIDVLNNPANWKNDISGVATVLLGFLAKDAWVTGGTKQAPTTK